jgi:hypothetical protein
MKKIIDHVFLPIIVVALASFLLWALSEESDNVKGVSIMMASLFGYIFDEIMTLNKKIDALSMGKGNQTSSNKTPPKNGS